MKKNCYLYHLAVEIDDLPAKPNELKVSAMICLPDGRVLESRRIENLDHWIGREDVILYPMALNLSCHLIEGLQKNLQHIISQAIYEKIKL